MTGRLSLTAPLPPPRPLPEGYPRHEPDPAQVRTALDRLLAGVDWAGSDWPALIEQLFVLGRTDIPLSRLAEGHLDAVRILAQAGREPVPGAFYGVWASRSQQTGVAGRADGDGLLLDGILRFASGAGLLDRALIPVWLGQDRHRLLDLEVAGLPVDTGDWHTAAMRVSRTHTVRFAGVRAGAAAAVGPDGFYLDRPGFFPGGVGVAACWVGGAARVADLLAARHPDPSPTQRVRLGRFRTDLVAAVATVRAAARQIEACWPQADWQLLATEARAVAAEAVRRCLSEARLVTGPAGVAQDPDLGHALADLELYVLQQNSDGDAGLLGDVRSWP